MKAGDIRYQPVVENQVAVSYRLPTVTNILYQVVKYQPMKDESGAVRYHPVAENQVAVSYQPPTHREYSGTESP